MADVKTYNVSKESLLTVTVPSDTRTYKSVGHGQLIDLTLESIEKAGFKLDKEIYSEAQDGKIANGRYTISNVKDSEMGLQVGWQNSINKTLSAKFAIGSTIFICSNGSVHGDFGTFKKKHQGTIQEFVPSAITEYIRNAGEVFKRMQDEREQMKKVEIDRKVKASILGRLFADDQIITATQLGIIAREIEAPTHDYGNPDSMWSMYNYATFAAKGDHPFTWMNRHINLHDFFTKEANILILSPPSINIPLDISPNQISIFDEITPV